MRPVAYNEELAGVSARRSRIAQTSRKRGCSAACRLWSRANVLGVLKSDRSGSGDGGWSGELGVGQIRSPQGQTPAIRPGNRRRPGFGQFLEERHGRIAG